jgi:hypothetical protein
MPTLALAEPRLLAPEDLTLRDVPTSELVRADLLARSLAELARHDSDRLWRGWLLIGGGTAVGGAAGFVKEPELRGMLALTSLVTLGRGIAQLSISTDAGQAVSAFEQQPMLDLRSFRKRLAIGEQGLAHVARQARRARIVEGSLTVFGAVAFVPLTFGLARLDDPQHRFGNQALDYVGLTLSIIVCASGLVHALVKSPAERIYQRYQELPR